MDLDEILEPFVSNFRRLFYRQPTKGEARLSIIKLALFGAYILANLLTFLQFATLTNPDPQLRIRSTELTELTEATEETEVIESTVLNYQISMTQYGELAHYLNFLVLVGALYFIITQDKPLITIAHQIQEWGSQSRWNLVWLLIGGLSVGLFIVLLVRLVIFIGLASFARGMSYYFGLVMSIIWWLVQPILFLGGSLLLLDTLTQEEQFRNRFGTLSEPKRRTAELFTLDLGIIMIIFILAALVFNVTLGSTTPELDIVTRILGIDFYQTSIYHLLAILLILIVFTGLNLLALGVVYVLKRTRTVILVFSILIISVTLISIITGPSLPTSPERIYLLAVVAVIVLLLIIISILPIRYIVKRSRDPNYFKSRIALLPWILGVGIFLAVLKTISVLLAPSGRLMSLSNLIDVLGLLFSILLGVIRVTTITEVPKPIKVRLHSRNPIKLVTRIRIPAYSKVLVLFYLAFIGFYLSLETHTISLGLGIPNDFRMLRLEALPFTSSIVFAWVFWRYKPLSRTTTGATG